jgi:hypothetical protein
MQSMSRINRMIEVGRVILNAPFRIFIRLEAAA